MLRALLLLLLAPWQRSPPTSPSNLKDGSYHPRPRDRVQDGRVRFYRRRAQRVEEIPLELADLKRTECRTPGAAQQAIRKRPPRSQPKRSSRASQREEHERIPVQPGVYYLQGKEMKTLKGRRNRKAVSSKGRIVLAAVADSGGVRARRRSSWTASIPPPYSLGPSRVLLPARSRRRLSESSG